MIKFSLEYHPAAEKEFIDAAIWYETKSENLGQAFSNRVEEVISKIIKNPLLYPEKKGGRREALVTDFPFVVVYKIHPKKNLILVLAVFHTKRHPRRKARK